MKARTGSLVSGRGMGMGMGGDSGELTPRRRAAAREYVERVLAKASPEAIRFQAQLVRDAGVSEDLGVKALGFKASEAILDRFLGKAAQEVRMGDVEGRPIVFSEKLKVLEAGLEAAKGAPEGGAREAFERAVTADLVDTGGAGLS
jgi:hypothetical protein